MKIKQILYTYKRSVSFRKYFLSIFSVLLGITIILGVSLSAISSKTISKSASEANAKMLNQIVTAQKFVLDEINKSFLSVVTNVDVQNFASYYRKSDINAVKNALAVLDSHIVANEYIESISVCLIKEDLVLSTIQGVVSMDKYFDKEFVAETKETPNQKVVLRKANTGLDDQSYVISFVQRVPFGGDEPETIIIFDTNDNYIKSSSVSGNNMQKIITNAQDVVMYSENENIQQNAVFNPKGRNDNGQYFTAWVGGVKQMVTYLPMDRYDWNYYISIPYSEVYKGKQFLIIMDILLCLLMMMLSFYMAYILSVKIYMPIKSISELIDSDEEKASNEIQMIKNNVVSLIDNNQNLSETLDNYLSKQKEMFLKEIIDGEFDDYYSITDMLSRCNLAFGANDYYAAFCIAISDYKSFTTNYSKQQQDLFSLYINDVLNEFVSAVGKGFLLNMGITQMILVMSLDDTYNDDIKLKLYAIADKLDKLIGTDIKRQFNIGVSSVHKGFSNICYCVEEARLAVETRVICEDSTTLFYDNMTQNNDNRFEYPFFIEKKILRCIKTGTLQYVEDYVNEFGQYVRTNAPTDVMLIKNVFMQLLYVSVHSVLELDRSINLGEIISDTASALQSGQEKISDLCECLMEFYNYIFEMIEQKQDSKNQVLVDKIKEYIIENIGQDLSVEKISNNFFVSESHLRRIFKSCTQIGIKKYIDEQRMEMAKEMLIKNPDIKIVDIAKQIGYLSVQAFTNAFKANTNMTPKAYRDKQNEKGRD